jgi:hypothetical protein
MKIIYVIKNIFLKFFISLFGCIFKKPGGRSLLYNNLPYYQSVCVTHVTKVVKNYKNPYFKSYVNCSRSDVVNNANIVFVTGRFRSGSTLLWNIFRDIAETTSYYEPFNERKWFLESERGDRTDNTHLGVSEYWREYLNLEYLDKYFNLSWCDDNLYMDSTSQNTDMLKYIDELIRSGDKKVVLQFNRLDFRLAWIRRYYPNAKIIHIYRHPREQWLSVVKSKENCEVSTTFNQLQNRDYFYLRRWGRDLRYIFPFLDETHLDHPYELFYLIWKLSYNFGLEYSDISVSIEELSDSPVEVISKLLALTNTSVDDISKVSSKVKKLPKDKWLAYASNEWFEGIESKCENTLNTYCLAEK